MSAPEPSAGQGLVVRTGNDGSFSLWSEAFGEGFHSGRGALREARETFLIPSQLERFPAGSAIRVLEVCVGTGCNLAVLLEACAVRYLQLEWIGLELDPEPLRLALRQPLFRGPWQPQTLQVLDQLQQRGSWLRSGVAVPAEAPAALRRQAWAERAASVLPDGCDRSEVPCGRHADSPSPSLSRGRILWGDARQTLRQLQAVAAAPFDLIWHDAFSPQHCPQLWSLEFLADLARLLGSEGRWISYCSAAAVREALQRAGLQLAALQPQPDAFSDVPVWSGGSIACPRALPPSVLWRPLTPMELEHLACSAGELYRDPSGTATAGQILAARQQAQAEALASGNREPSGAWRRRWAVEA